MSGPGSHTRCWVSSPTEGPLRQARVQLSFRGPGPWGDPWAASQSHTLIISHQSFRPPPSPHARMHVHTQPPTAETVGSGRYLSPRGCQLGIPPPSPPPFLPHPDELEPQEKSVCPSACPSMCTGSHSTDTFLRPGHVPEKGTTQNWSEWTF